MGEPCILYSVNLRLVVGGAGLQVVVVVVGGRWQLGMDGGAWCWWLVLVLLIA